MSGSRSSCMFRVHTAIQELQAVTLMSCRMPFQLSGKLVALQLDNSTAKAYVCNEGGTVFLFLSIFVCHILSLANKHGISVIPAYIPTHLNMAADYLLQGTFVPKWHLLPDIVQAAFQLWFNCRWICWLPHVPINVSFITLWKNHYPQELWG